MGDLVLSLWLRRADRSLPYAICTPEVGTYFAKWTGVSFAVDLGAAGAMWQPFLDSSEPNRLVPRLRPIVRCLRTRHVEGAYFKSVPINAFVTPTSGHSGLFDYFRTYFEDYSLKQRLRNVFLGASSVIVLN